MPVKAPKNKNGKLKQLAKYLHQCEVDRKEAEQIVKMHPEITIDDAYLIQKELVKIKLSLGNKIIGYKLAFTTRAKQKSMGISSVGFGYLFDYMKIDDGGEVNLNELIHPKAEAEIAFIIGNDLYGDVSPYEVIEATKFVAPAVEFVDSRYKDFKFELIDVIADNFSASRFVIGSDVRRPNEVDLRLSGVIFERNGIPEKTGALGAVLGNPAIAVSQLVKFLSKRGEKVRAGSIILTGSITEAIDVKNGDFIKVTICGVGEASTFVVQK
ncbi:MAG: fumarylacetoacetate hydrolase family protein [Candidatus Kryptonium sp.]